MADETNYHKLAELFEARMAETLLAEGNGHSDTPPWHSDNAHSDSSTFVSHSDAPHGDTIGQHGDYTGGS